MAVLIVTSFIIQKVRCVLNDVHSISNVSPTLLLHLFYSVKENDLLCSSTHTYKVLKVIGSGYYGDVARCQTKETKENVAVKIFKNPDYFKLARNEVSLWSTWIRTSDRFHQWVWRVSRLFLQVNALKHISLRPHPNFIKFIEDFKVNERPCLVFELLHMDLLEFTKHHETCIANLKAVRPIAQQVRVPKGTDWGPNFTSALNTEEQRKENLFFFLFYFTSVIYLFTVIYFLVFSTDWLFIRICIYNYQQSCSLSFSFCFWAAVCGSGLPQQCWCCTHRHQTQQHHVCQRWNHEDQADWLRHGFSNLKTPTRM